MPAEPAQEVGVGQTNPGAHSESSLGRRRFEATQHPLDLVQLAARGVAAAAETHRIIYSSSKALTVDHYSILESLMPGWPLPVRRTGEAAPVASFSYSADRACAGLFRNIPALP